MRTTFVLIQSRDEWVKRFGHLPPHPLSGYECEGLYDKKTGDYCGTQRQELCMPYVIPDIPDHIGPSGRIVTSQSGRREEIKRSEGKFVEWEPVSKRPRGVLADRKFAEKYGAMKKGEALCHLDEKSQDYMAGEIKKIEDGLADPLSGRVKARPRPPRKVSTAERNEIAHVLSKHGIRD